jgi:hypothetical protein
MNLHKGLWSHNGFTSWTNITSWANVKFAKLQVSLLLSSDSQTGLNFLLAQCACPNTPTEVHSNLGVMAACHYDSGWRSWSDHKVMIVLECSCHVGFPLADCLDSEDWAGRIWPTIGKISLCMHHPIPQSAEWTHGIILSEIATACKMTQWVGLQALVRLTSSGLPSQDLWTTTRTPPPRSHPALQEQRLLLSLSNFHFQTQKWDTEGLLTSPSMWE